MQLEHDHALSEFHIENHRQEGIAFEHETHREESCKSVVLSVLQGLIQRSKLRLVLPQCLILSAHDEGNYECADYLENQKYIKH